jgi:hypothetical protein
MATIRQVTLRVNNLNLLNESMKALAVSADEFVEQNVDQMRHGKNKQGNEIGEYASPAYSEMKHRMNKLAGEGNVDLILTGAFTSAMFLETMSNGTFKIDSKDVKRNDLVSKYGSDIFGLGGEYKSKAVNGKFKDELFNNVHKVTKL